MIPPRSSGGQPPRGRARPWAAQQREHPRRCVVRTVRSSSEGDHARQCVVL